MRVTHRFRVQGSIKVHEYNSTFSAHTTEDKLLKSAQGTIVTRNADLQNDILPAVGYLELGLGDGVGFVGGQGVKSVPDAVGHILGETRHGAHRTRD